MSLYLPISNIKRYSLLLIWYDMLCCQLPMLSLCSLLNYRIRINLCTCGMEHGMVWRMVYEWNVFNRWHHVEAHVVYIVRCVSFLLLCYCYYYVCTYMYYSYISLKTKRKTLIDKNCFSYICICKPLPKPLVLRHWCGKEESFDVVFIFGNV